MSSTEPAATEETSANVHSTDVDDSQTVEPVETAESPTPASKRCTGVVKWFSVTKGFGFIQPDDREEEVFVHQTTIRAEGFRSLREGEIVEFDLEFGDDGRGKAIGVTGPQGVPPQGAPRRMLQSAPPYALVPAQPHFGFYDPYAGYPHPFLGRGGGRFPGRGFLMPGRGAFAYGRGFGPALERPPPPGTPGISSGFQVVVHNLPWSVTWQELKDVFSHTPGLVRADVIIDAAGRSRGFGTVRYKSREEAMQAAEMMNNVEIGGRIVTVRIDRFA